MSSLTGKMAKQELAKCIGQSEKVRERDTERCHFGEEVILRRNDDSKMIDYDLSRL